MKKEKDGADAKAKAEVKKDAKKDRKDAKGKDVVKKEAAGSPVAASKVKKESDKEKEVSLGASKQVAKASAKQEKENGVSRTTTVVKEQVEAEVKAENGKVVKSSKRSAKTTTTVTKKKVFDLPGQKHEPPEERDPQRIFYETLREQKPSSEMAEFWLMEHGLLPEDEAKAAFEKKQRQKKQPSTPVKLAPSKAVTEPKSNGTTSKQQASAATKSSRAKRERESDEDDDDFVSKPTKRRAKKLEV